MGQTIRESAAIILCIEHVTSIYHKAVGRGRGGGGGGGGLLHNKKTPIKYLKVKIRE